MIQVRVLVAFTTAAIPGVCGHAQVFPADETAPEPILNLARSFERTIYERDVAAAAGWIDGAAMTNRALAGIDADPAILERLRLGMGDLATRFVSALVQDTDEYSYTLVRVRRRDGEWRALYRLLVRSGALNFHDVLIVDDPDKGPLIHDFYVYTAGEDVSRTMRRTMELSLAQGAAGARDAALLGDMNTAFRQGHFVETLRLYRQLPESLQRDKAPLIVRAAAAVEISNDEIIAAAQDFERHFPNDPALDLMLIDALAVKGEWDEFETRVKRLENFIGGDAYLRQLRAMAQRMQGKLDEAANTVLDAVEIEPSLTDVHWEFVEIALAREDFNAVAAGLTTLVLEHGVEFNDLSEIEIYRPFVESDAYLPWLEGITSIYFLTDEQRDTIEEYRKVGERVIARYLDEAPSIVERAHIVEALKARLEDEAADRPDPMDVARGLGTLLGDTLLRADDGFWGVFSDHTTQGAFAVVQDPSLAVAYPIGAIEDAVSAADVSIIDTCTFRTIPGGGPLGGIPAWADFFDTREQVLNFKSEIYAYFKGINEPILIDHGYIVPLNADGDVLFGLTNVGQICAEAPRAEWPELIRDHFERVQPADRFETEFAEFDVARDRLALRLWDESVDFAMADDVVRRQEIVGLQTILMLDFPDSMRSITTDLLIEWGRPKDELFRIALDNIAGMTKTRREPIAAHGKSLAIAVTGDTVYVAPLAVEFCKHFPDLVGAEGVLIALPTRDTILALPVDHPDAAQLIPNLVLRAIDLERRGPGSVTTRLFWYRGGTFTELQYHIEGEEVTLIAAPEFEKALARLNE